MSADQQFAVQMLRELLRDDLNQVELMVGIGNFTMARMHYRAVAEKLSQIEDAMNAASLPQPQSQPVIELPHDQQN